MTVNVDDFFCLLFLLYNWARLTTWCRSEKCSLTADYLTDDFFPDFVYCNEMQKNSVNVDGIKKNRRHHLSSFLYLNFVLVKILRHEDDVSHSYTVSVKQQQIYRNESNFTANVI